MDLEVGLTLSSHVPLLLERPNDPCRWPAIASLQPAKKAQYNVALSWISHQWPP